MSTASAATTSGVKIGEFTLKEKMNIGEVRQAKQYARDMIDFQAKLAAASEAEIEKMTQAAMNRSDQQDAYLFAVFMRCLEGMTEEKFNKMTYPQAGVLFDKLLAESGASKKSNPLSG